MRATRKQYRTSRWLCIAFGASGLAACSSDSGGNVRQAAEQQQPDPGGAEGGTAENKSDSHFLEHDLGQLLHIDPAGRDPPDYYGA